MTNMPLPPQLRIPDLYPENAVEIKQLAQATAERHDWGLVFQEEEQPNGLCAITITFSAKTVGGTAVSPAQPGIASTVSSQAHASLPAAPEPASIPAGKPIPFAVGKQAATRYWPVVTDRPMARVISYVDNGNVLHGYAGRRFLADRLNGARYHVGVDLFANVGDKVVACEDGRIVSFLGFLKRDNGEIAYALMIEHDDFVVNYGEVAESSLTRFGLRVGDRVTAGHGIGFISGTAMLHFETYTKGTSHNQRWMQDGSDAPASLLNPTRYLLDLAANGVKADKADPGDSGVSPAVIVPATPAIPLSQPVAPPPGLSGSAASWNFAGGGQPLTPQAFDQALVNLGNLEPALLWALIKKETPNAAGFMADRRPLILYERHVFSRKSGGIFDKKFPEISSPHPYGNGGYGSYPDQYDRLAIAMTLDPSAALMACSWGIGQTLGEGYKDMGYASVQALVGKMIQSEDEQIDAVVKEINHKGVADALRQLRFQDFAKAYNGAYAPPSYWIELEDHYLRYKTKGLPDITVRRAQILLVYLHYMKGMSDTDGKIGPNTMAALKKFQEDETLPVTSQPDAVTLARLEARVFS